VSINYTDGFYIPIQTSFVLEGSAYDCEGDDLLYSWEELDVGPQSPIGNPIGNAPLFTVREVSSDPVRYFPNIHDLLYNSNSGNSEILPFSNRNLTFRFIARDNHKDAGGTDWADVSFKADETSGPFLVKYPNNLLKFKVGEAVEVKWDVANTDNDLVNCQKVDILLSVDKGYTYPYTLKYQTPNDGKEIIYLPDTNTSKARIMVKASDNIFLDVCNYNLKIREREDTSFLFDLEEISGRVCLPYSIESKIITRGFNGFEDSIRFEVVGLPGDANYTISPEIVKPGETANITFDLNNLSKDGHIEVFVLGISTKGDTVRRPVDWDLYTNTYKSVNIVNPEIGSTGQSQNPVFRWEKNNSYDYVNFYISSNPSFPEGETFVRNYITDTFYQPTELLEYSTLYYWKLEYGNICGLIDPDTIYTFSTYATDCNKYVSEDVSEEKPKLINSKKVTHSSIFIDKDIEITDLSVKMTGYHSWFKDITASIAAPSQDTVLLFRHKSFNYQGLFDMTFDDQAFSKVKSPPKGFFRPDSPLSQLNGKSGKGEWVLLITDNKYNRNGSLRHFSLDICAKVDLINPKLVNNNLMKVPYNRHWAITSNDLKVTDGNNTDDELTYTIVKEPFYCSVYKGNMQLFVGDKFTQSDINNGVVNILYPGSEKVFDKFYFTVIDGVGGAIGITAFNIESDEKTKVEEVFENSVQLFPNPAGNTINVRIDQPGNYRFDLYDLRGQKIMSKNINAGNNSVDISNLIDGVYIVKIYNDDYNFVGKVIKQD